MGYFIDTSVSQLYAHQTGPTWPLPDKELKRKVLIMSGYMKDEPTFPELRLLQKGSFGSEFYHYKMDASGHTVYDNCEPEKEDRIDTDCEEAPNILAGPLTQDSLRPLKNLVKEVYKLGTMVFTDVAADVSSVNASNLRQALGNMVKYQHIQGSRKLRELNDHMRTDGSNPDILPCRARCTLIAQRILRELGLPNADKFVVCSVRIVDCAAEQYHLDREGFGPSVLVIVLSSNGKYKVRFARMKSGGRDIDVSSDKDSGSDIPLVDVRGRGTRTTRCTHH